MFAIFTKHVWSLLRKKCKFMDLSRPEYCTTEFHIMIMIQANNEQYFVSMCACVKQND